MSAETEMDVSSSTAAASVSSEIVDGFFEAVRRGDLKTTKYYLEEHDLKINMTDVNGNTAFYYAALCGHTNLMYYLKSRGARGGATDLDQYRCWYNALTLQHRSMVPNPFPNVNPRRPPPPSYFIKKTPKQRRQTSPPKVEYVVLPPPKAHALPKLTLDRIVDADSARLTTARLEEDEPVTTSTDDSASFEPLDMLQIMFPGFDLNVILSVFEEVQNDINRAADALLSMQQTQEFVAQEQPEEDDDYDKIPDFDTASIVSSTLPVDEFPALPRMPLAPQQQQPAEVSKRARKQRHDQQDESIPTMTEVAPVKPKDAWVPVSAAALASLPRAVVSTPVPDIASISSHGEKDDDWEALSDDEFLQLKKPVVIKAMSETDDIDQFEMIDEAEINTNINNTINNNINNNNNNNNDSIVPMDEHDDIISLADDVSFSSSAAAAVAPPLAEQVVKMSYSAVARKNATVPVVIAPLRVPAPIVCAATTSVKVAYDDEEQLYDPRKTDSANRSNPRSKKHARRERQARGRPAGTMVC